MYSNYDLWTIVVRLKAMAVSLWLRRITPDTVMVKMTLNRLKIIHSIPVKVLEITTLFMIHWCILLQIQINITEGKR